MTSTLTDTWVKASWSEYLDAIAQLSQQKTKSYYHQGRYKLEMTLSDDLGNKRLLYEEFGAAEYWVVDVQNAQVIAFEIKDGGSRRLEESLVFSGLKISILNETLQHFIYNRSEQIIRCG